MNLYLITIKSYDCFYVIAPDTTTAYEQLLKLLNDNDLFFTSERKLMKIELLSEAYYGAKNIFKEV